MATDIYKTKSTNLQNYYSFATIKTSQTGTVVYGAIGTVNTGAYNNLVSDRFFNQPPYSGNG